MQTIGLAEIVKLVATKGLAGHSYSIKCTLLNESLCIMRPVRACRVYRWSEKLFSGDDVTLARA